MMQSTLVAAGLLATLAAAQTTTKIVPRLADPVGNRAMNVPFSGPARVQMLFDSAQIAKGAATISALRLRAGPGINGTVPRKSVTCDVWLGLSAKSPAQMSTSFAQNPLGSLTPVFRGTYRLPAQPLTGTPGPYNMTFKLAAPFVYVILRGNLLVQIDVGSATSQHNYPLDAVAFGRGALARQFGTGGRFASGERPILSGSPQESWPGGKLRVHVQGMKKPYPTLFLFGLSKTGFGTWPLPFDLAALGAPGNQLYTSVVHVQPAFLFPALGLYYGSTQLPIPASSPGGFPIYAQALSFDAGSNAAGLVLSNASQLDIASNWNLAPARMLYGIGIGAQTGRDPSADQRSCLALQLEGRFQ